MNDPKPYWIPAPAAWQPNDKKATNLFYPSGFINEELNSVWVECGAGNEHAHALLLGQRKTEFKKIQRKAGLFSALAVFFIVLAQFTLSISTAFFWVLYGIFMSMSSHFARKGYRSIERWLIEELAITGLSYRDIALALFANDAQVNQREFFRTKWIYPAVMVSGLWVAAAIALNLAGQHDADFYRYALAIYFPLFMLIRIAGRGALFWPWTRSLKMLSAGLHSQLDIKDKVKLGIKSFFKAFLYGIGFMILVTLSIIGVIFLTLHIENGEFIVLPSIGLILLTLEGSIIRMNMRFSQRTFTNQLAKGEAIWNRVLNGFD